MPRRMIPVGRNDSRRTIVFPADMNYQMEQVLGNELDTFSDLVRTAVREFLDRRLKSADFIDSDKLVRR